MNRRLPATPRSRLISPARLFATIMLLIVAIAAWPVWTHAETTSNSGATQITALPTTISTPGTYYLAQDFAYSTSSRTAAISIAASNVTIDFNGHTITNTQNLNGAGCVHGYNVTNITVRNGILVGFYSTIFLRGNQAYDATANSYGHLVENVTFVGTTGSWAVGIDGVSSRVYHCRALLQSVALGPSTCFYISGRGNTVEDCDISGKSGSGSPVFGIQVLSSTDNFVANNRISGVDYGLYTTHTGGFKYRDTLTSGVNTPYTGGTDAGNNN